MIHKTPQQRTDVNGDGDTSDEDLIKESLINEG